MSDPRHQIKAALLQVHSIAGLALALLWALVGLTGATMSFEDEIEASLNRDIMHVDTSATRRLTPDELIARLQAAGETGKVSAVMMTSDPSAAVRIRFARSEGGWRPSSVYIDPYNGHVLGSPRGGRSSPPSASCIVGCCCPATATAMAARSPARPRSA